MYLKRLLICILSAASITAFAQRTQKDDKLTAHPATTPVAATHSSAQGAPESDAGEHIFEQRCSRCHNAPDGFSPRISGTIVRHMRVRASLSQREEEELLRFFNP
jgi:cytochrome c5